VFGALGNPVRLRIVSILLAGPATTAELAERLDQPSTGQLFHHLKELLTTGLVHQPVRGTYAIRRQDIISLLALLAASLDLAASGGGLEPA
jgi:DNA-binding transcriptional ArsR family regulator